MRILVLGEGPTDLGKIKPDSTLEIEGVLPILVRRLLEDGGHSASIELLAKPLKEIRLSASKRAKKMGPSTSGYANKLRALLGLKEGRQADVIIAVVDRDGSKNRDRIEDLNQGRDHVEEAGKKCAVGIAIEMLEAWLLADEKALRQALAEETIQRQPDPESLTSRDDKSDRHPKRRLQSLMEKCLNQTPIPAAEVPKHYAIIARVIDLNQLRERCPQGFGPFADQVLALIIS